VEIGEAESALGPNADHTEIVRVLERVTGTELKRTMG